MAVSEATYAWPPELAAINSFGFIRSGEHQAILNRQPAGITDMGGPLTLNSDRPHPDDQVEDHEWSQLVGKHYRSCLVVPLIIKDRIYGGLIFCYRDRREFSDEDYRFGMSIADQTALAIENAQLRSQVEQAAAVTERTRLARELHDSVTQSLYSLTLYAEAAARLLSSGKGAEAADHLRELRDTAQEALREMRLLIFELRPPVLEKSGLAAAIQTRLDAVELRGGVHAVLQVTGEEQLSPVIQQELYHIANEALNNTLKHAHAQSVTISLEFASKETQLEIRDDGLGFELAIARSSGGQGLRGIEERAQKIGGKLEIMSEPGKGTSIRIQVQAPVTSSRA
jgi:signal transduction histidine kinase